MRRSRELDRIEQMSESVIGCLVKLYVYPNSLSTREWIITTYELLHSTHKVGLLNRFPNPDQIYEHAFEYNYHILRPIIDTYIKISRDGYYEDELRRNFQYKTPICMISTYFRKVADKLSTDGAMDLNDVERYLRVIGFIGR